ncbi:MAG: universal stress protein [Planctomycetota bacterium]|jgi:nucleotide-binding universal stress UspA family protein
MKILVAADGSSHSQEVIDLLARLKFPEQAGIEVISVLEHPVVYAGSHGIRDQVTAVTKEQQKRMAEQLVAETRQRLAGCNVDVSAVIRDGHPAEEILKRAESISADLIVAGSRGLSALDRFLLGSTTERLLKHAHCDVLVSRPVTPASHPSPSERLHIMVAYDGSPAANGAIDDLTRLPIGSVAEVRIVTVLSLLKSFRMDILQHLSAEWAREKETAEKAALAAAAKLESAGYDRVQVRIEESDDVPHHLIDLAENWPAEILMTGANGHSRIERFLLGSVSTRLTRHAPCAVWLTRTEPQQD